MANKQTEKHGCDGLYNVQNHFEYVTRGYNTSLWIASVFPNNTRNIKPLIMCNLPCSYFTFKCTGAVQPAN